MNLLSLDDVCLAYGLNHLLDHVKLQIMKGERICLIGRNGAGKSSLLKIIEGSLLPDSGTVWRMPHLRLGRLTQELPQMPATVYEFVATGLAETGKLLANYHALTHRLEHTYQEKDLLELQRLQQAIDACEGWQFEQDIKIILTKLDLSPDVLISELSGGWQRRAALAQALVTKPTLLLLDEPTNHLDIEAIQWLEDELLSSEMGLLFITHDRALLQRLATRILELDRGHLTSWPGDYQNFLRRKEEMLHAESKHNANFDKKLAQEEKWIRQGIKARRTRNEGRVRALEQLRFERSQRREQQATANFNLNEVKKSGKLVIEAEHISHSYHDKCLIDNFSLRVIRGDRIGLLGPNGIGKSTLLNLLLGKIPPQKGMVTLGTKLEVAYFDQLRAALNYEKSVSENVVQGTDYLDINGEKRHIISYLGDFLFTPQRAMTPVKALSGGECNRLLLARLFSQPANLLVLDEPTNDLDIETLELLEELLTQFTGTLLIVSHDREFLDNVVTSILCFEGNGKIQEYIGGYHDYLRQHQALQPTIASPSKIIKTFTEKSSPKKLSFKEQKELTELPQLIQSYEKEQVVLQQQTHLSNFYKQDAAEITRVLEQLAAVEKKIQKAYSRWEELENKNK